MSPIVWITRARPGAEATARRVRVMGLAPIVEPLIETRPLANPILDLAGAAALAFTSAAAVAYFAALTPERGLPAYAVGDATAAALRAAGFARIESAGGDAAALAALLRTKAGLGGPVIHPGPAEPAADLATLTAPSGIEVRSVPIYESVARLPPAPALERLLHAASAVLLHSGRAAGVLAEILQERPAPALAACCISSLVARPLAGLLDRIVIAAAPAEAALLSRLAEVCGRA